MEQRVYHGNIRPEELAQVLLDDWDRDDTVAQALEAEDGIIVQIGQRTAGWFSDEPHQALTLSIEQLDDGVQVTMGQQQWYKGGGGQIMVGGLIGFFPFFFSFPLGQGQQNADGEIDQSLPGQIWQSIERYTNQGGAATGPTRRLSMITCPNCGVSNPAEAQHCSACGTALGAPISCPNCGRSNPAYANFCIHCGTALQPTARSLGEPGRGS